MLRESRWLTIYVNLERNKTSARARIRKNKKGERRITLARDGEKAIAEKVGAKKDLDGKTTLGKIVKIV